LINSRTKGVEYLTLKKILKTSNNGLNVQETSVEVMIDQKQLKNLEYFKYLVCMITNDSRRTLKLNPGFP
jgi:hypothetical protein